MNVEEKNLRMCLILCVYACVRAEVRGQSKVSILSLLLGLQACTIMPGIPLPHPLKVCFGHSLACVASTLPSEIRPYPATLLLRLFLVAGEMKLQVGEMTQWARFSTVHTW